MRQESENYSFFENYSMTKYFDKIFAIKCRASHSRMNFPPLPTPPNPPSIRKLDISLALHVAGRDDEGRK